MTPRTLIFVACLLRAAVSIDHDGKLRRRTSYGTSESKTSESLESVTVLREFQEAGLGSSAAKARLSNLMGQLDMDFELRTHRHLGTKFVELDERLQDRVTKVFGQQASVLAAAHHKVKEKHPVLHSKFLAAQAHLEKHPGVLGRLRSEGLIDPRTEAFLELLKGGRKVIRRKRFGPIKHVFTATKNLVEGAGRAIGDGLELVGDVVVKSAAWVGQSFAAAARHVNTAVIAAAATASDFAKASFQFAQNCVQDLVTFAAKVAKAVGDFAAFIWDMLTGWDCSLSGKDLLDAAKNIFSLNPKGFTDLRNKAKEAKNFKDGHRLASLAICKSIWTALELSNPLLSFVYNIVTKFKTKCGMLKNFNPALSLGVTLDGSVGGLGVGANIGMELGVAVDANGNRMCYVGGCVSAGFKLDVPPVPASGGVGVTLSFWGDAGSIPGTLNIIEFAMSGALLGMGIDLDLTYMYSGNLGDFAGIAGSFEIKGTTAVGAVGTSLMTGKCDTPLCLTTCGDDCGGGAPTCGYGAVSAKELAKIDNKEQLKPNGDKGDHGSTDGKGAIMIRSVAGICLDASERKKRDGKVHMWECDHNQINQMWSYNRKTLQIKSRDGLCLDTPERNKNGGRVRMEICNPDSSNQQWEYSPGINQIKNNPNDPNGKCLDSPERQEQGGEVHMWTCKPGVTPNGGPFYDGQVVAFKGGKDNKYCADAGDKWSCDRNAVGSWEKFTVKVISSSDKKLAFKGGKNGKWCSDEGDRIRCDRGSPSGWETFTFNEVKRGVVALKGGQHGKWCADEGSNTKCNRGTVSSSEGFTIDPQTVQIGEKNQMWAMIRCELGAMQDGTCTNKDGERVQTQVRVLAKGDFIDPAKVGECRALCEKQPGYHACEVSKKGCVVHMGPVDSGGGADSSSIFKDGMVVTLRGGKDKKFCSDEGDNWKCTRDQVASWEKFTVKYLGDNKVALKGGRSGKWCADEGDRIRCNRAAIGIQSQFIYKYLGGRKAAFLGGKNRKWCSDEGGDGVKCNRGSQSSWETFTIENLSGGTSASTAHGCMVKRCE